MSNVATKLISTTLKHGGQHGRPMPSNLEEAYVELETLWAALADFDVACEPHDNDPSPGHCYCKACDLRRDIRMNISAVSVRIWRWEQATRTSEPAPRHQPVPPLKTAADFTT